MKVDMKPVEYDMKQLFSAFIDCYEALDYITERAESDDKTSVAIAQHVKKKGDALATAVIASVADKPKESIFVLAVAAADIVVNVSNMMFQDEARMAMEEDE